MKRWSAEEERQLIEAWPDGAVATLARRFGVARCTIQRKALSLGLEPHPEGRPRRNNVPIPTRRAAPSKATRWRCPDCGRLNALQADERTGKVVRVGCEHESPQTAAEREREAILAACRELRDT